MLSMLTATVEYHLLGHICTSCIIVFSKDSHNISKLHNLCTNLMDSVQAYSQVAIKHVRCLKLPAGVVLSNKNGKTVLKLLKNVYVFENDGLIWFKLCRGVLHKLDV